jgi:hypothetical protein
VKYHSIGKQDFYNLSLFKIVTSNKNVKYELERRKERDK